MLIGRVLEHETAFDTRTLRELEIDTFDGTVRHLNLPPVASRLPLPKESADGVGWRVLVEFGHQGPDIDGTVLADDSVLADAELPFFEHVVPRVVEEPHQRIVLHLRLKRPVPVHEC